ncbi:hypothetical protein DL771_001759 [Monosporascus sp. 5C6A]|nr:hypothetical protein DL771_001759 [Monosporascus sp. 5C6A]
MVGNSVRNLKGFLDLINAVDNVHQDYDFGKLYKLLLPHDTRPHGFMLPETVSKIPWSSDFVIDHKSRTVQLLDRSNGEDTSKASIAAFQNTVDVAIDADIFPMLHKDHSEMYKIVGADYFVCLERFSAPLFGVATRGAHMTAYVRSPAGLKIWVPRRSAQLFVYPSKLDSTVAGGVKAEHSPLDCIVAEADEEASLPADFVREHALPTGIVTYVTKDLKKGVIRPSILYIFDIELPKTMIPEPHDDEVSEFNLWSVEEVKHAMLRQEFKPNSALVLIDFLIRHGIITEENEYDYVEIATRLKRRLPVPTMPEHRK